MHGMSLQKVMLLTLQGGMGLSGTKSSFIKDDRVMKTEALISLSVYIAKDWGIKSVVGERCILDAVYPKPKTCTLMSIILSISSF